MRKPPVLTPLAGNLQARQTTVSKGGILPDLVLTNPVTGTCQVA